MSGQSPSPAPGWDCEDCGWRWPLSTEPALGEVCENCQGLLISIMCSMCEQVLHEPGDCFCAPCRVEVLAMLMTINDPVEHVLSRHWSIDFLTRDDSVMCRCGERFTGPVYHRRHVAELVYETLGLDEPMPHTRTALEDS